MLVDAEWTAREQRKLQRTACRRPSCVSPATLEAVDFTPARRLNRQQVLTLGTCAWLAERHNLIVTGPVWWNREDVFICSAFVEAGVSPRLRPPARSAASSLFCTRCAVGRGDFSTRFGGLRKVRRRQQHTRT